MFKDVFPFALTWGNDFFSSSGSNPPMEPWVVDHTLAIVIFYSPWFVLGRYPRFEKQRIPERWLIWKTAFFVDGHPLRTFTQIEESWAKQSGTWKIFKYLRIWRVLFQRFPNIAVVNFIKTRCTHTHNTQTQTRRHTHTHTHQHPNHIAENPLKTTNCKPMARQQRRQQK